MPLLRPSRAPWPTLPAWPLLVLACQPLTEPSPAACPDPPPRLSAPDLERTPPQVSRHNLESWVTLLTSPELEGRRAGSDGSRQVVALLARELRRLGLEAPFPNGDFCQSFPFLEESDHNLVAHLKGGTGSTESPEVLLVGAHYDGLGMSSSGHPYPGADDNASGVAALLEVARLATTRLPAAALDVVFVAFGAEEVGLVGSRAYRRHPTVSLERIVLFINLDMVGRELASSSGRGLGYVIHEPWRERIEPVLLAASRATGLAVYDLESALPRDRLHTDAEALSDVVPTLDLTTGLHDDYHQLGDTAERIHYEQIEATVDLVLAVLEELAGGSGSG